mgnify:CR=1 FL=1
MMPITGIHSEDAFIEAESIGPEAVREAYEKWKGQNIEFQLEHGLYRSLLLYDDPELVEVYDELIARYEHERKE